MKNRKSWSYFFEIYVLNFPFTHFTPTPSLKLPHQELISFTLKAASGEFVN